MTSNRSVALLRMSTLTRLNPTLISYAIIVNHPRDQKETRTHFDPKDPNYRELVLARHVKANRFVAGHRVKQRGTSNRGTVSHVETDHTKVNWVNNKPFFLEVDFDSGVTRMCIPSQLKRTK